MVRASRDGAPSWSSSAERRSRTAGECGHCECGQWGSAVWRPDMVAFETPKGSLKSCYRH
eukprot:361502-Chlamydomonas_euryale.AAC.5